MTTFIGIYLFGLSALLFAMMAWRHMRGRHDLLSVWNIFLVGFVLFQLTSVAVPMLRMRFEQYIINNPGRAGIEFVVLATSFLLIAGFVYRKGYIVRSLAARVPRSPNVRSYGILLVIAGILTVIAVPLRFAVNIPAVGIVASIVGVGAASIACGLVGWVWAPRLFNPTLAAIAVVCLGANLAIVMTGEFGRRNLLAVFGCLMWAMYYSHWRYVPARVFFVRLGMLAAGPVIFVALYSSVRNAGEHERTAGEQIQHIVTGGDLVNGIMLLLSGQNTGTETLWLIENYPENFRPRPLMTPFYAVAVNVPRAIWPGKPEPLSTKVASQATIRGVNRDNVKLSPGIIGSVAAEGGWYALIVYAVLMGMFLRFFDELVQLQPRSPFIVLPVGSTLGQVMGFARGDTSTMVNLYYLTVFGTLLLMLWIGRVARGLVGSEEEPTEYDEHWDEHAEGHDYADSVDAA